MHQRPSALRRYLRPFLIYLDPSVEIKLSDGRPNRAWYVTQSNRSFFDSKNSTERSNSITQSKEVVDSTGCISRIAQSKTCMNPSHGPSRPESTRTSTHLYQVPHSSILQLSQTLAWLLSPLLLLLAASRRGTFRVPPASTVYHTTFRCQRRAVSMAFSQQQLRLL